MKPISLFFYRHIFTLERHFYYYTQHYMYTRIIYTRKVYCMRVYKTRPIIFYINLPLLLCLLCDDYHPIHAQKIFIREHMRPKQFSTVYTPPVHSLTHSLRLRLFEKTNKNKIKRRRRRRRRKKVIKKQQK